MKICSIPGCENKHKAKGYCDIHYKRWWKYDDPLHTQIENHNMCYTSEYKAWESMKRRCHNKNDQSYNRYGGRGIAVCDRWRNSFIAFFEDMGLKPFPEAQLDRINNDGNYEPGNCEWISPIENTRKRPNNKLTIEKAQEIRNLYKNSKITQKKIATLFNISQSTVYFIVNNKYWV